MEKGTNGINDLEEGERLRFSTTMMLSKTLLLLDHRTRDSLILNILPTPMTTMPLGKKQKMKYIMAKTMVKTLISLVMILPMHNLITAVLIITLSALKRRSLRMQVKLSLI